MLGSGIRTLSPQSTGYLGENPSRPFGVSDRAPDASSAAEAMKPASRLHVSPSPVSDKNPWTRKKESSHRRVPSFAEWFEGRFWREWLIGRRNKPTEVKSKQYIFDRAQARVRRQAARHDRHGRRRGISRAAGRAEARRQAHQRNRPISEAGSTCWRACVTTAR